MFAADPAVTGAYLTLAGAIVAAVLVYVRGMRADSAVQAQAVIDTALTHLSKENREFRDEVVPKLEADIKTLNAAVAHCEREKNQMRQDFTAEMLGLRADIAELKRRLDA